jgi:multidrug efflux pump subunit AcrA (membrane-fusion protein)
MHEDRALPIEHLASVRSASPERGATDPDRALREIVRLLESSPEPPAFYTQFLGRVLAAAGGVAGAFWERAPDGTFCLEEHADLGRVGLDRVANGPACHRECLKLAAQGRRLLALSPAGGSGSDGPVAPLNRTPFRLLLAPILLDQETVAVLEVWQDPRDETDLRRELSRFLGEAAALAAAYLHKVRWSQLRGRERLWTGLEAYTRQVHASLDPREVAYLVANQGRALLGCDQVSVALRGGRTVRIEAVSGTHLVDARGRLAEAMRTLFERALAWGEKLVYTGAPDATLPPTVLEALDGYLAESHSKLLVLLPLHPPGEKERTSPCRAGLLAESFDPGLTPTQLEDRLQVVAAHTAGALHNALAHNRATQGLLARGRDRLLAWTEGRFARKVLVGAASVVAVVAALALVPAPLRVEARGHLLPVERQIVHAPLHGKIIEMKTQPGDQVARDQELLLLEDLGTQLKVEELGMKVHFAEQRLALLGEQLRKAGTSEERNALIKERIQQEYELRRAGAEREILLQGSLNPRKAAVTAPLAGKVVTFDVAEQLLGKTVKQGDPLLRIARVEGPWEVELDVPGGALPPVREGLLRSGDGLPVELLLASHPLRTYAGRLRWDGLGGETTVKDNAVVLPVRVEITDPELAAELDKLPVNLEVRARIDCGWHSVGRVWFGDLLEFLYEHVVF